MSGAEKLAAMCEGAQAGGYEGVTVVEREPGLGFDSQYVIGTFESKRLRTQIAEAWIKGQLAPAILADAGFLKPLFGDSEVCLLDGYAVTGIGKRSQCSNDHFEWASEFVPRYKYIAAQMVLAADSTEERIGWLWERWKEAKRDEE